MPCCVRDEGRSLGIGLQDRVPNHRKLRGAKVLVVSVPEKAGHELDKYLGRYTALSVAEKTARRQRGLANFVYARYADDCAPRRQEGSGTGPELERHAA